MTYRQIFYDSFDVKASTFSILQLNRIVDESVIAKDTWNTNKVILSKLYDCHGLLKPYERENFEVA